MIKSGPLAAWGRKISPKTIAAFFMTFALCAILIAFSVVNKVNVERLKMEQLIVEKSIKANDVLSKLLYKTQTLATIVLQYGGNVENFEQVAAMVVDHPAILNVLIAPNGVVSDVFPLAGNEAVIGLDFFSAGAGNKEAIQARDSGQLVFGGPFESVQGGQILVGRLPVFMPGPDGESTFWGLVSVTLKYPQALEDAGFDELQAQGFAYEVWRINPDDGQKQIVSSSGYSYNKNVLYLECYTPIQNAEWYFRILPVRAWYEYYDTWILVFLGLCISVLVAYVTQNNIDLRVLKQKFELLSHTDPLTGIYNRRFFVESGMAQMDRVTRADSSAYIVLLDLDFFKRVNDSYGHAAGDEILKELTRRVRGVIRPYDLFARYGGEEFILLFTDVDEDQVLSIAERIRLGLQQTPMCWGTESITVTASFGITRVTDFHQSINTADKALYMAKQTGRNKIVVL